MESETFCTLILYFWFILCSSFARISFTFTGFLPSIPLLLEIAILAAKLSIMSHETAWVWFLSWQERAKGLRTSYQWCNRHLSDSILYFDKKLLGSVMCMLWSFCRKTKDMQEDEEGVVKGNQYWQYWWQNTVQFIEAEVILQFCCLTLSITWRMNYPSLWYGRVDLPYGGIAWETMWEKCLFMQAAGKRLKSSPLVGCLLFCPFMCIFFIRRAGKRTGHA